MKQSLTEKMIGLHQEMFNTLISTVEEQEGFYKFSIYLNRGYKSCFAAIFVLP